MLPSASWLRWLVSLSGLLAHLRPGACFFLRARQRACFDFRRDVASLGGCPTRPWLNGAPVHIAGMCSRFTLTRDEAEVAVAGSDPESGDNTGHYSTRQTATLCLTHANPAALSHRFCLQLFSVSVEVAI